MSAFFISLKTCSAWSCVLSGALLLGSGVVQAQPRLQNPIAAPAPIMPRSILAVPAPVGGGSGLVWSQLETGALTPEAAWQSGKISLDDVVRAANAPRLFESDKPEDVRLREALV